MKQSFSFAVTLHRVFDSAPPDADAVFYSGGKRVFPVQKPNGLYVFSAPERACEPFETHVENVELTVLCAGFMPQTVLAKTGEVTPAALYPDRLYAAPAGWRLVAGEAGARETLCFHDTSFELKLTECGLDTGVVRIRSRKGMTGGTLLFSLDGESESALILEKQPPDIFYISKLSRHYTGGEVRRVYAARANDKGEYFLAVPQGFEIREALDKK